MSLAAGTKLGPCKITGAVGLGAIQSNSKCKHFGV